jgi:hypothetical protein
MYICRIARNTPFAAPRPRGVSAGSRCHASSLLCPSVPLCCTSNPQPAKVLSHDPSSISSSSPEPSTNGSKRSGSGAEIAGVPEAFISSSRLLATNDHPDSGVGEPGARTRTRGVSGVRGVIGMPGWKESFFGVKFAKTGTSVEALRLCEVGVSRESPDPGPAVSTEIRAC